MPSAGILLIAGEETELDKTRGILLTSLTRVRVSLPSTAIGVSDAFLTTRSAIGKGIGLFVAKQFVEGHHGEHPRRRQYRTPVAGYEDGDFLPFSDPQSVSPI